MVSHCHKTSSPSGRPALSLAVSSRCRQRRLTCASGWYDVCKMVCFLSLPCAACCCWEDTLRGCWVENSAIKTSFTYREFFLPAFFFCLTCLCAGYPGLQIISVNHNSKAAKMPVISHIFTAANSSIHLSIHCLTCFTINNVKMVCCYQCPAYITFTLKLTPTVGAILESP